MSDYKVFIPKSLDKDYNNMYELIEQLSNIDALLLEGDEVTLYFEKSRWIDAEMTVFLGMICDHLMKRGVRPFAVLDNMALKTKELLKKNGFLTQFPETGEILVNTDTLVTRDVLDLIEPLLDNGLGNFVVEPSDDAVIPEPITLQSIKVYSPKDPERVVTLLSNGNPDAECRVLTPADVISNISYWLGLAEGINS